MARYDFACYDCQVVVRDVIQGMNEKHEINCPECGRAIGQVFYPPQFHLNKSVSDYYDEGLGMYVPSKSFREDTMKAKGLTEYNPNPRMKKAREEAAYLRGQGPGGNAEAAKVTSQAAREVHQEAQRGRIREALSGTKEEIARTASDFGLT